MKVSETRKNLMKYMKWQKPSEEVILLSWMQDVAKAANVGHNCTDTPELYRNSFREKKLGSNYLDTKEKMFQVIRKEDPQSQILTHSMLKEIDIQTLNAF